MSFSKMSICLTWPFTSSNKMHAEDGLEHCCGHFSLVLSHIGPSVVTDSRDLFGELAHVI